MGWAEFDLVGGEHVDEVEDFLFECEFIDFFVVVVGEGYLLGVEEVVEGLVDCLLGGVGDE